MIVALLRLKPGIDKMSSYMWFLMNKGISNKRRSRLAKCMLWDLDDWLSEANKNRTGNLRILNLG